MIIGKVCAAKQTIACKIIGKVVWIVQHNQRLLAL